MDGDDIRTSGKAGAAFQTAADGGNAEGWYWLGTVRQNEDDEAATERLGQ